MKGVVFTLDAVFAMIMTTIAISVLLYFHFAPQTPYILRFADSQTILGSLLTTNVSSIAQANPVVAGILIQQLGAREQWPQFQGDQYHSGSSGYGPISPYVSMVYQANSAVNTPIVAGYGNIYFGAGSFVYAVNATGETRWTANAFSNIESSPVLYNGELIFANATNVIALNAYTGQLLWVSDFAFSYPITSPMLLYASSIYFGDNSANLYAISPLNGTEEWKGTHSGSGNVDDLVIGDGELVAETSGNFLQFWTNTNPYNSLSSVYCCSDVISTPATPIAVSGNIIALGAGEALNETYVNGTMLYALGGYAPYGVAAYGKEILYQTNNGMAMIPSAQHVSWYESFPYLTGFSQAYPVAANNIVYALWGNGWLTAQNITTGSMLWRTSIPYSSLSPYMTIAYGKLFVIAGNRIIAYGACSANPSTSVMAAAVSLYVNGDGSCADYMVDSVFPMSNYSLFSGNTFLPGSGVASFNGKNSMIETGGNYTPQIELTIGFWADPAYDGSSQYIVDTEPQSTWRIGFTSDNDFVLDPGTHNDVTLGNTIGFNKWQYVTMTAQENSSNIAYSLYVNATEVASGTVTPVSYVSGSSNSVETGSADCGSEPAGVLECIPLKIENNQLQPLVANTQILISIDTSNYATELSPELDNVEVYNGVSGQVIGSWLEAYNSLNEFQDNGLSAKALIWVKLPDALPAESSDSNIYLGIVSSGTNLFTTSGNGPGLAPQLYCTSGCAATHYAEYDNGANVFIDYDNFEGTTINSMWDQGSDGGAGSVDNGLTIDGAKADGAFSLNSEYSGNVVVEAMEKCTHCEGGEPIGVGFSNAKTSTGNQTNYISGAWFNSPCDTYVYGGCADWPEPEVEITTDVGQGIINNVGYSQTIALDHWYLMSMAYNTTTVTGDVNYSTVPFVVHVSGNYVGPTLTTVNMLTAAAPACIYGCWFNGTALNPSGTLLYATSSEGYVFVFNTATNVLINTISDSAGPNYVAFNPAGSEAYVTDCNGGDVNVINVASNSITNTIHIGANACPTFLTFNPSGSLIYVSDFGANEISVINPATNLVINTITGVSFGDTLGPWGIAFNPAGTIAYSADRYADNISVINVAENSVVDTIYISGSPSDVLFNSAGTTAYVTDWSDYLLIYVNVASNSVTGSTVTGGEPAFMTLDPSGNYLYLENYGDDTLGIVNLTTETQVAAIPLNEWDSVYVTLNSATDILYAQQYSNIQVVAIGPTVVNHLSLTQYPAIDVVGDDDRLAQWFRLRQYPPDDVLPTVVLNPSGGTVSAVGLGISNVTRLVLSNLTYPYNGLLANLQIYGLALSQSQIEGLYGEGIQGEPLQGSDILSWYPLAGDADDYANQSNSGYPYNLSYKPANYLPKGLINAYEIGKSSAVVPAVSDANGTYGLYNIGVEAWR